MRVPSGLSDAARFKRPPPAVGDRRRRRRVRHGTAREPEGLVPAGRTASSD